jgi:hypothetical protein
MALNDVSTHIFKPMNTATVFLSLVADPGAEYFRSDSEHLVEPKPVSNPQLHNFPVWNIIPKLLYSILHCTSTLYTVQYSLQLPSYVSQFSRKEKHDFRAQAYSTLPVHVWTIKWAPTVHGSVTDSDPDFFGRILLRTFWGRIRIRFQIRFRTRGYWNWHILPFCAETVYEYLKMHVC